MKQVIVLFATLLASFHEIITLQSHKKKLEISTGAEKFECVHATNMSCFQVPENFVDVLRIKKVQ